MAAYWPSFVSAFVSLGVGSYALSLPHMFTGVHGFAGHGYDDGVYLGAAIALVHGIIPYRDFAFVQPPGILIIMSPIALVGRLIGDRDALILARCFTVLVAALNAGLVAWIVRYRGKVAMVVSGLTFALFPLSVTATNTLMLEPYLVLLCLIGIAIAFHNAEIATPNRLFIVGLFFSFALSVKLWAVFPIAVMVIHLLVSARHTLKRFIQGLALGCLVLIGPFIALAPRSFVRDALLAQEGRVSLAHWGAGISLKILYLTGLAGLGSFSPPQYVSVIALVVAVLLVFGIMWLKRQRVTSLDRFLAVSAVVTAGGMLSGTIFYEHYSYFPAAFGALLAGVVIGLIVPSRLTAFAKPFAEHVRLMTLVPLITAVSVVLAVVVVVSLLDLRFTRSYLAQGQDNGSTLAAVIPAGSCVISDDVSYLVDSSRISSSQSNCPAMIDYYGTWLQDDPHNLPPTSIYTASLVSTWIQLLHRADYLVLIGPESDAYPRTPATSALINGSFRLVYSSPGTYTYCNIGRSNVSVGAANDEFRRGLAAFGRQDYAAAVEDLALSLTSRPCNVAVLYQLGLVKEVQGKFLEAAALYREVLAIRPGYAPAATNLSGLE